MLDSIQSLLDSFPESVVQVRGGTVLASNEKARQYLPQLTPGAPLPACIPLPEQGESGTGSFVVDDTVYSYSCKSGPEGCVLSFRPSPREAALKEWQLDGALQQLRALLGDILAEAGGDAFPGQGAPAGFNKTFHRLFRLISNLEFMQQAAGEEGVPFHPVTMDLAGLCRDTVRSAGDLLRESGIQLEYRSRESGLLIPGDPELLRRLLLGLISNAARAVGEKSVQMLRVDEINAVTGYIRGGCSPVGMKKRYPTVFHRTAADFGSIYISAGKIGAQVEVDTGALLGLLQAGTADLASE